MDTWWKKLIYSSWLKAVAILGFCLVGFGVLFSSFGYQVVPRGQNIYHTYYFDDAFVQKAGYVRDYIVRYRNDEILNTITAEDIQAYKVAHVSGLTDELAKQKIMKDRKDYNNSIDNALGKNNVNVDFYAESLADGIVFTNMDLTIGKEKVIEDLMTRPVHLSGDGHYIYNRSNSLAGYDEYGLQYNVYEMNDGYESNYDTITHYNYYKGEGFEGEEKYEIYVALKDPLVVGDTFYSYARDFENAQRLKDIISKVIAATMLTGVILMIYWLVAVGKTGKKQGISMKSIDKIPCEIQLIGIGISTLLFICFIFVMEDSFNLISCLPYIGTRSVSESLLIGTIVFGASSIYVCMCLAVLSSLIRHIKNKSIQEYIGIIRLSKQFKNYLLTERRLTLAIVAILGVNAAAIVIIMLLGIMLDSAVVLIILIAAWSIVLALGLFKITLDYKRILQGTKAIARGELNHKIELENSLPVLTDLADTINTMGTGLEKAVEQSVKSERLKAELITNVSHDLKTPLTSIISYIDLLKGEEINNETAKEYIGVLDERSSRLKQLVEDLVEASKAVTGNVEAKLDPFMLDELVLQALGEYTDRLEAQGVQIVTNQIQPVKVMADSRHMWRVVENLLANVSKYAMPQTRAYIEVLHEGEYGVLVIKNISKEALNIDPSELTQRFVRGDASRTTEGSGLGLAIAESLMHLQAGQMSISIDGDLFKVEVRIPAITDTVSLNKK